MTHAAVRAEPVVRTRPLPPGDDPLAALDGLGADASAWFHDGVGFVARGVAARVALDDVPAALAAYVVDDEIGAPGTGPIAIGALPFGGAALAGRAEMVIPATVVGRAPDGRLWRTDVVSTVSDEPVRAPAPTRFHVVQGTSRDAWRTAVTSALREIDAGRVGKVVLARDVRVTADVAFDRARVVRALLGEQPGCYVFAVDGLVGASPELLVSRSGRAVVSRPLAGTAPEIDDGALARLAASRKDAAEHGYVVDEIAGAFRAWCGDDVEVVGPHVVRFSSIAHLATTISGRLAGDQPPSALALARALHPTPAVAGTPTPAALSLIDALEPGERGRYAGPVGWVDARGDGEFALALRSAELDGRDAVLRAGAGIVAGSDPEAEWLETEAKLAPMLSALVRP